MRLQTKLHFKNVYFLNWIMLLLFYLCDVFEIAYFILNWTTKNNNLRFTLTRQVVHAEELQHLMLKLNDYLVIKCKTKGKQYKNI